MNVDGFLEEVQVFTRINEITTEVLQTFIDKIVVHHRVEDKHSREQEVEIYYNFIGQTEVPDQEERKQYAKSFGKNRATKKENQIALAI